MSPTDINGATSGMSANATPGTALTPGSIGVIAGQPTHPPGVVPTSTGSPGGALFPGLIDPTIAKRQRLAASAYVASAQAVAQAAVIQQAAAFAQQQHQANFFNTGMLSGVPVTSSALQQAFWAGKAAQLAQKTETESVAPMVSTKF